MSAGHTPGPWVTDTDGDGKPFAIVTSTHDKDGLDDDVCEVYGGNDDDDSVREANAHLIAAAPELLAACETCLRVLYEDEHPNLRQALRDVIARAQGLGADVGGDAP